MPPENRDSLEALRDLSSELRALLDDARTRYTLDIPPSPAAPAAAPIPSPVGSAPQAGADALRPAASPAAPPKAPAAAPPQAPEATPSFLDEEGEENALPLEFATATMGHVLLGQGRATEAGEVFRAVLAKHPGDAEALRGVGLLGAPASAPAKVAPAPEAAEAQPTDGVAMLDRMPPPTAYGSLVVRALPVDPTSLAVFWEAPVALTGGVPVALCVVSLRPGHFGGVERHERLAEGLAPTGERFERSLPVGATHHVALGMMRAGDFVPLAHASPVETPRGAVSDTLARAQHPTAARPLGVSAPVAGPTQPAGEASPVDPEVFERALAAYTGTTSASSAG